MRLNTDVITIHLLGSIHSDITRFAKHTRNTLKHLKHSSLSETVTFIVHSNTQIVMTDPTPPAAPLTAEAVQTIVRQTMMVQQSEFLKLSEENALKTLREEHKKNQRTLLDTINFEVEAAREYDTHEWKTPVNKDNFHNMHQIHQLWKRTERFVGSLDVSPEQVQLKAASMKAIEQGKQIAHDRMKLIRFADRDGWKAALHFQGDNIADSAEEAKKMRKSKKETELEKEADKKRERDARERRNRYSGRDGQGSSRDREPWSTYNRSSNQRPKIDSRYCFNCARTEHIARNCPRNFQN